MDVSGKAAVDDERLVVHNHKLFAAFNRRKLEQIRRNLTPAQRRVLDLVPILLHLNLTPNKGPLSLIPPDAPAGVVYLDFPLDLESTLERDLPGAVLPKKAKWGRFALDMPIRSLLLMGSMGSIGQTRASDFDFWVVIDRRELGPAGEAALARKCELLSQWIEKTARSEATFFLVDVEDVRANRFGEASGESAGSAMAMLLKDEFYRSMTLLAGQTPWWWVLPPGLDPDGYAASVAELKRAVRLDPRAFVDLGPLGRVDVAEFFGASLWEIHKSLDRPFKSALKLALMEAYSCQSDPAEGGNGRELLAETMKRRVLEEGDELPDSYLLMFERVAEHLAAGQRMDDLDSARICLYLKSNPRLTARDLRSRDLSPRKKVFTDYIRQWGWDWSKVEDLNAYTDWPFPRRQALGEKINRLILGSYARLGKQCKIGRGGPGANIDRRDLTALGRRLMLFYGRSQERVAFLPNLLEKSPPLSAVHLAPVGRAKSRSAVVWEARENVPGQPGLESRLIRAVGLPHILAWLAVNGLAVEGTTFYLDRPAEAGLTWVTMPEIQSLFKVILSLFGGLRSIRPSREELLAPSRVTTILIIPNLDAPHHQAKPKTLGLLHQNNWGELFATEYDDPKAGFETAKKLIAESRTAEPTRIVVHLPDRPTTKALSHLFESVLAGCRIEYRP